ncbi:AMP-binding protein [Aerophototrophica crusticola]|uniref:AMP-binding protein n=1 Tax=Aerophototrophica crusticola TaxID=1709002 RepID=A0A858R966_9PROT|nr:AMP-binding protein [Rhodospirillaceae bacterium B3]
MAWWREDGAVRRLVADLLAGELARLRPGQPLPPATTWEDGLEIGPGGLGADSLELVTLATTLVELLQLQNAGLEDYLLARRTLGGWVGVAAASLARCDGELVFRTSGSTGTPKPCRHALAGLEGEAAVLADLLSAPEPPRRLLAAVPCHHIYGFIHTLLLPKHLGIPVLDVRGKLPGSVAALLRPGDLVIGFPEFWATLLRLAPALPPGVTGVTSTAPCPDAVADGLRARGLARLVQVYGSSETAGIGWRDDPAMPYRLFPRWSATPDGTALRRQGGDPLPLPDQVDWEGLDLFRVGARRDGAVQVGGTNVFPDRVAAILREHPGVADAAVRPFPAGEGLRLKAAVVPAAGQDPDALRADLDRWAATRLTPAERPRSLVLLDALPRTTLGKPADWPLPDPG